MIATGTSGPKFPSHRPCQPWRFSSADHYRTPQRGIKALKGDSPKSSGGAGPSGPSGPSGSHGIDPVGGGGGNGVRVKEHLLLDEGKFLGVMKVGRDFIEIYWQAEGTFFVGRSLRDEYGLHTGYEWVDTVVAGQTVRFDGLTPGNYWLKVEEKSLEKDSVDCFYPVETVGIEPLKKDRDLAPPPVGAAVVQGNTAKVFWEGDKKRFATIFQQTKRNSNPGVQIGSSVEVEKGQPAVFEGLEDGTYLVTLEDSAGQWIEAKLTVASGSTGAKFSQLYAQGQAPVEAVPAPAEAVSTPDKTMVGEKRLFTVELHGSQLVVTRGPGSDAELGTMLYLYKQTDGDWVQCGGQGFSAEAADRVDLGRPLDPGQRYIVQLQARGKHFRDEPMDRVDFTFEPSEIVTIGNAWVEVVAEGDDWVEIRGTEIVPGRDTIRVYQGFRFMGYLPVSGKISDPNIIISGLKPGEEITFETKYEREHLPDATIVFKSKTAETPAEMVAPEAPAAFPEPTWEIISPSRASVIESPNGTKLLASPEGLTLQRDRTGTELRTVYLSRDRQGEGKFAFHNRVAVKANERYFIGQLPPGRYLLDIERSGRPVDTIKFVVPFEIGTTAEGLVQVKWFGDVPVDLKLQAGATSETSRNVQPWQTVVFSLRSMGGSREYSLVAVPAGKSASPLAQTTFAKDTKLTTGNKFMTIVCEGPDWIDVKVSDSLAGKKLKLFVGYNFREYVSAGQTIRLDRLKPKDTIRLEEFDGTMIAGSQILFKGKKAAPAEEVVAPRLHSPEAGGLVVEAKEVPAPVAPVESVAEVAAEAVPVETVTRGNCFVEVVKEGPDYVELRGRKGLEDSSVLVNGRWKVHLREGITVRLDSLNPGDQITFKDNATRKMLVGAELRFRVEMDSPISFPAPTELEAEVEIKDDKPKVSVWWEVKGEEGDPGDRHYVVKHSQNREALLRDRSGDGQVKAQPEDFSYVEDLRLPPGKNYVKVAETSKDGKVVGEWSETIEVEVPKIEPKVEPATAADIQILASGHSGGKGWVQIQTPAGFAREGFSATVYLADHAAEREFPKGSKGLFPGRAAVIKHGKLKPGKDYVLIVAKGDEVLLERSFQLGTDAEPVKVKQPEETSQASADSGYSQRRSDPFSSTSGSRHCQRVVKARKGKGDATKPYGHSNRRGTRRKRRKK